MFMAALSIIIDKKSKVRGIGIRYCLDGGLFNLARLRTILKTRTCFITDLIYADDCILDTYTEAYTALGLKLNKTKTKIMSIPQAKSNVQIQVYAHQLENVESFNYQAVCSTQKPVLTWKHEDKFMRHVGLFGGFTTEFSRIITSFWTLKLLCIALS
jgi:hypothetical protein